MPSADTSESTLSTDDRNCLLQLARNSIQHGLTNGTAIAVDCTSYASRLQEKLACFVTLNRNGALRGCIGHLEAQQPLVKDVADNAFAAAFRDPRFPSVTESEMAVVEIHISILSPAQPIEFDSEQDLIDQLHPGQDGLILKYQGRSGTFLPSVWESLQDAESFLKNLKLKAGLTANFWSDHMQISRYTTESFSDSVTAQTSSGPCG